MNLVKVNGAVHGNFEKKGREHHVQRNKEGARMLVIPLLREPVLMQDVYQPNQVMRLLRISKPRFYELTDLKQRNPLPTHNYGPGKRGTIILREELIEWVASLPKGIGNGKPGELQED